MVWMKVPYTNFHNLNQDWIIKTFVEFREKMDEIIALSTVKYADPIQWNITAQYEANTIVVDPLSGTAYLATQAVPSGVLISNTDYWTPIFTMDDLLTGIREGVAAAVEETNYATSARAAGTLVWVGHTLVRVVTPMSAGDAYNTGTGGNCEVISIEELLADVNEHVDQVVQQLEEYVTQIIQQITNTYSAASETITLYGTEE